MNDYIIDYESIGLENLNNMFITYYARKKGRGHVKNGTVCQDYCMVKSIDDETHIVCVADGHGGEEYSKSDIGSRLACEVFIQIIKDIKRNPDIGKEDGWLEYIRTGDFKSTFIDNWENAVLEDYYLDNNDTDEKKSSIIRKYGTTFLFAVYHKNKVCLGQLGDGAILLVDDLNQCQLFKRHNTKTSSLTNSLASSRGRFAFMIDVYDNDNFPYILLSTDGIYDRLDNGELFLSYAESLIEKLINNYFINDPFFLNETDISRITRDDCTIALSLINKDSNLYEPPNLAEYGFTDTRFMRRLNGIDIFKASGQDTEYEIHILNDDFAEIELKEEIPFKFQNKEDQIDLPDGRKAVIYVVENQWKRMNELIECEDHLEKKYRFDITDNESAEDDTSGQDYFSNEIILDIYEKILKIKDYFRESGLKLHRYAFESIFITKNNEIIILSDAFYKEDFGENEIDHTFRCFLDYFNIIGKMSCNQMSIPLFGCKNVGQNIMALHDISLKKPFCRVIYNEDKKLYGLWNISGEKWKYETGNSGVVLSSEVIRLDKDQVFYVSYKKSEGVDDNELTNGLIRYDIHMFKEAVK